jgi:signal transduction histidine kinase
MLAPTEDLLARPDMPGDVRDQLQLVHRNALRLLRLVNTLLDFASLEAGRMMAHYEPQDVASLTTDLASGFRSLMERAGLRYEVQCDSNAGTIWMDRDMWEKIVLNLLSNAYKFTLSGTVNVSLHALPASDAPWAVELAVADTGCGIPQADLPHLFERFHRVSAAPARTHEGTGIGLALVYELIGLHGGELRVESQAGGGSTFRVRLRRGHGHLTITPQAPAPPTRSPAPSYLAEAERWTAADTEGPEPAAVPDGDKPSPARILIADDNRDMRDYVRQLLGATYTVNTVADGQAALEAARRNPPDLILADIMMPLMDGIELVRHMRSDAMLRTIPVILLSARAGEESRVEGLASGADDYLVKPFTARELRARVAAHLSAHQVRRESLLASERDRRHLYDILQRAPAFIATLRGPEHVFEYANELYRKMVAGSRELIGKPLLLALPEIQGQGIVELLDDVYRRGQPYVATELRSVVRPRTDEEPVEFIFNVVFQPMLNEAHQVDAIMLHAVDVSAQVRARREVEALAAALRIHQDNLERLVERRTLELRERTEELTLANQRLQELDRLKTEFVGTMSHELRTPLNAIIGFSEMLRDADLSPDDTREYLEHVCEGGQLLLKLVNQALDFASIEAGHLRLYPTEFRLESLVQDVVNLLSQRARERDVRLAVRAVPTTVTADEDRLGQILINLVANAIKFSPPGSTVQVAMHNDADAVRVQVSDSGAGIHEQDQARIFEPFGPGNTLQRRAGTGLGLTISRRLAEAHGGRIELVSAPNQGSCFILVLPAAGTEM